MKQIIVTSLLVIGVACAPILLADEAGSSSSHHSVKDSANTTKVKAKLVVKHLTTLTRIKMDTDENGAVWLGGRAPTRMRAV